MNKQSTITRHCQDCKQPVTLTVNNADWKEFIEVPRAERRAIQDLFPYLTPGERDLLLIGSCDPCMEKFYKTIGED